MTKKTTTKKPVKTVVKEKDTFAFRQIGQNLLITINNVTETLKVVDKLSRDKLKTEISSLVENPTSKTKAVLAKIIKSFKNPATDVKTEIKHVAEKKQTIKKASTAKISLEEAKKMLKKEDYTVAKTTTYPVKRRGEY
jgi:ABC-type antimicrobial peptide transport system ATPase subunit